MKQCTEAPSNIEHATIKSPVYVRAKAERIKAYKCVPYAKKERKICFQGSVKYRRVDRTVWNHNTMPLPITLDPLDCKNIIRHLNGTNNKILNHLHYNKTFTLLEDTGTFTFCMPFCMPFCTNKVWMYDPNRNPYHNCPAPHRFEVNLVS